MRRLSMVCLSTLLIVGLPVSLSAQACQGSTAPRGSGVFVADAAFTDGANSFGPTIGGNFEGPIFAGASYAYTDVDGTDNAVHGVGGQVGAELATEEGLSWCLDGSFTHQWVDDIDADGQVYGADTSLGYAAGEGDVLVVPHASVGVVHSTANVGALEASDTAAQFAGGISIGSRSVFVGGTVSYATFDESDPVFGVGVGVVF